MNFFNIINEKNDFLLFSIKDEYTNVLDFLNIKEDIIESIGTYKKEFRWSPNNDVFSNWMDLSVESLRENIKHGIDTKFWIEFRYTLLDDGVLNIQSISLDLNIYDIHEVYKTPLVVTLREKGNLYYPLRLKPFSLNPYKQHKAIRLQKDLSYMVNEMYGHEIVYYRAIPDKKNIDVILGEWTLYNVDETPKTIKVLVQDNQLPDNKFQYEIFGPEFENPFEVHIDKRYFEWVFGHKEMPQKRDIIYMPLTNRIYEVNSSQPIRDFMNEILYYKIDLKKYNQKSKVKQSKTMHDDIDEISMSPEELFGDDIFNQTMDIVSPEYTMPKTMKYDYTREFINDNIVFVNDILDNNYTTISETYYDLSKIYQENNTYDTAVIYKEENKLTKYNNFSYTCWFKECESKQLQKNIKYIDVNESILEVIFDGGFPNINIGQYISILDTKNKNIDIFGEVIDMSETFTTFKAKIKVPEIILDKIKQLDEYWCSSKTLIGKLIFKRNFISSYSNDTGLSIDSIDSKYFRIILNSKEIWFEIPFSLNNNIWYGLVIGVTPIFKQCSLFLYNIANNKNTNLKQIYKHIKNLDLNEDIINNIKYSILASNLYLTNIRLLNEMPEEEKHSDFLNQNIIQDSHMAIIIDNAKEKSKLPYLRNVK